MRMIWATCILLSVLGGCSSDAGKGATDAQAVRPESGKEPAVTAATHFAAGQFAESQENPSQAIRQYQAAVKLQPDHKAAWYRLGILYTEMKQWPEAVTAWKGYIKATNQAASGYSDLGFAYQLSGNDVEAEAAYKTGISRDPMNRPCRVNYGLMLARQGKYDSAIAQWQVVLKPAEVHYDLASVYEQRGDRAQARLEYQHALQLDPTLADAKTKLARLGKN